MIRIMRRAGVFAAAALALTAVPPLGAQQHLPTGPAVERALHDSALVTQIPGVWVAARPSSDERLTTAERHAMQGALSQIAALWRASLGALPGVEADESQNADWLALPNGGHVAGGDVKLLLWPYSIRNGKLEFYDNAARAIFWVNRSVCNEGESAAPGTDFIFAPRVNGRFHGFPMLDSVVVITHRSEPPCLPVTRGEFMQALVDRMARAGAHEDSAWNAEAAKRERDIAEVARTNPAVAASAREQMTQMKRVSDSLRLTGQRTFGDALARMSPAERALPLYMSDSGCRGNGEDPTSCFVDASAPGARAVVRPNPAFLDATRPADVQVVTLGLREIAGGRRNAAYPSSVMDGAFDRFDWNALSALVH